MGYFSALYFEAFTLGLQKSLGKIDLGSQESVEEVKAALAASKTDADFKKMTTGGGNNYAAALKQRIEFIEKKVEECLQ